MSKIIPEQLFEFGPSFGFLVDPPRGDAELAIKTKNSWFRNRRSSLLKFFFCFKKLLDKNPWKKLSQILNALNLIGDRNEIFKRRMAVLLN